MLKEIAVGIAKELTLFGVKKIKKVVLSLEHELTVPTHTLDLRTKEIKSGIAPVIDIKTKQRIA